MGKEIETFVFCENMISTGSSNIYAIGDADVIYISFNCTGSFECSIQGRNVLYDDWKTILYTKASTYVQKIDLDEWSYVRVNINSIEGSLSCYGRAVEKH